MTTPSLPPSKRRASALSALRLKRAVRLGIKSLWLHRLRSLLTVLGIVFGVCSVIAMLAIGEGASFEAQEQIKNLGSQNIIIQSAKPSDEKKISDTQSFISQYGLTYTDIKRIRASIPGVTVIVPGRIIRDYIWNTSQRVDGELIGTVAWYPAMRNHPVEKGRFFSEIEMEENATVCVLGADTAKALFPFENPLGKDVRVGVHYFRVIGVMQPRSKGPAAAAGANSLSSGAAPQMFIPLSASRNYFGETIIKRRSGSMEGERVELHEVTVQVEDRDMVVEVSLAIRNLLRQTHNKTDYEIIVPLELLRRAERTKYIFNIVLGSIAAISLLVGGIGIMNIMLASVTERTREIGIRRALGAKRKDIIIQFLVETVLLSGTGGLIGVVLGVSIPILVTYFSDMITIVTFWSPALAFSISAFVGILFGLYPALRAADMDPVEALRHE